MQGIRKHKFPASKLHIAILYSIFPLLIKKASGTVLNNKENLKIIEI